MSRDFDIIVTLPLANAGPLLDGDVLPVFYPDPQALGGGITTAGGVDDRAPKATRP